MRVFRVNNLVRVRGLLGRARRHVGVLLDLGRVPDGHPLEERAWDAFNRLETILQGIEAVSPGVREGPAVYPIRGEDPRRWPTHPRGRWTIPRGVIPARWVGLWLSAPGWAERARLLGWPEYLRALRESTPQGSAVGVRRN